jgi:hypothetical protein
MRHRIWQSNSCKQSHHAISLGQTDHLRLLQSRLALSACASNHTNTFTMRRTIFSVIKCL